MTQRRVSSLNLKFILLMITLLVYLCFVRKYPLLIVKNLPMPSLTRICQLLEYIHRNIQEPLSLELLAEKSCWSRWQLQRVFQHETGFTVASYIRQLKLSQAAQLLLNSRERIIDIALATGFNSEISFTRAFKQHFSVTPKVYRQKGALTGVLQPLVLVQSNHTISKRFKLKDVRIETLPTFNAFGVQGEINGLLSEQPDFAHVVPSLWQTLDDLGGFDKSCNNMGLIDVRASGGEGNNLHYWAMASGQRHEDDEIYDFPEGFSHIQVPKQTYAVLKHEGPISDLSLSVEWFIFDWLPQSGYRGVDGIELERYPADFEPTAGDAVMEYWLPIQW